LVAQRFGVDLVVERSLVRGSQLGQLSLSSGVGKSSTGLHGWGLAGCVHLCLVTGNTVWSHMASDIP